MTQPDPDASSQSTYLLDVWLDPDRSRNSPQTPSRLRQLADAQATLAAAWSSAIGGGGVLMLTGGFIWMTSGNPSWMLVLGVIGVVLIVLGASSWTRVRGSLPNASRPLVTRGPGSTRGGVVMVTVIAVVLGAILATTLPEVVARGAAMVVTLAGAYMLIVALLVACILVPATVMGRARDSFRRRLRTDPALRRAVEDDLKTWCDPVGDTGYGPL